MKRGKSFVVGEIRERHHKKALTKIPKFGEWVRSWLRIETEDLDML